jgi:hypothetical protein
METVELKAHIHKMVDTIQSEEFLKAVYGFLLEKEHGVAGRLWDSLTVAQQQEVMAAFEESEDERNLIDNDVMIEKLQ